MGGLCRGQPRTEVAFKKSELAGRTLAFLQYSHQPHVYSFDFAYYLGIYWSGWIVLIKNEILITTEMVWPASSDK